MHEIAFQADKRFAGWSVCADCSSLFPFYPGILFVITFTRKIYSTSSHVFSPDSLVLLLWRWAGNIHSSSGFSLDYCLSRLHFAELSSIRAVMQSLNLAL